MDLTRLKLYFTVTIKNTVFALEWALKNLKLKMGQDGPHPQRAGPSWNSPPFVCHT